MLVSGSDGEKSVRRKKQKLIIGSDGERGLILEERQTWFHRGWKAKSKWAVITVQIRAVTFPGSLSRFSNVNPSRGFWLSPSCPSGQSHNGWWFKSPPMRRDDSPTPSHDIRCVLLHLCKETRATICKKSQTTAVVIPLALPWQPWYYHNDIFFIYLFFFFKLRQKVSQLHTVDHLVEWKGTLRHYLDATCALQG